MSGEDLPSEASSSDVPDTSASDLQALLTTALESAREAVYLDTANNCQAALSKYCESVQLLREVLGQARAGDGGHEYTERASITRRSSKTQDDTEEARVQAILDTYTARIDILYEICGVPVPFVESEHC
ncbi:hypothetical protein FPV67DRAFT_1781923 [Lyophyllum atratum]|nr:hypothetical protein FPV67DRAFT_1781923 [Lyophyllum atratum]